MIAADREPDEVRIDATNRIWRAYAARRTRSARLPSERRPSEREGPREGSGAPG